MFQHRQRAKDHGQVVVEVVCDAAGKQAGELVAQALPDGGQVMLFIGRLEQDNSKFRRQGVLDVLLGRTDRSQDYYRENPDALDSVDGEIKNDKLVVLGRADDVIISGGENLSLNAVEASLNSAFPAIEFAAFAVEDPQWGQSLQIAVVGSVSDDEINAHLEKDLGAFAKPKGIHRLTSLPLLGIGKVDRKSLAKGVAHE